ncbi:UvrD-helicase domain-containing protein [Arthrobacter sp. B1I2]|uniref:UvrD-helicase domain-containing protein n=1 Tax=Arthrobacter sp. B1I2 TaxID=3042263 RepID=UPI002780C042|nr:UvrD-helicase domain-containing protein [Arthrobacter sp. B1I2]MDQ0733528.1 hypothetical protein [Arthrobacter sp. B1I2]
MSEAVDLATLGTGAVVAPAGHGKTYSIGRTIENHPELRILVLTHTNAGIAALRRSVASQGRNRPRIETISAFSLRLVRAFPARAEWKEGDRPDLACIQSAALRALKSKTVVDVVAMGFDLLIVDEFQDCSVEQAQTVEVLSGVIPTVVLGDPLQAIFDFGAAPSAAWNGSTEVLPLLTTLTTPHRWKNTNPSLGEWLALARADLLAGRRPTASPHPLEFVSLARDASQGGLSSLIPRHGTTAIISPDHANINALSGIARSYKGRVRVAEKTDLSEVRKIARTLDSSSDRAAVLVALIAFAAQTRTGVSTAVVQTLKKNLTTKGTISRSKQPIVLAAARYLANGSAAAALSYFRHLINGPGGYNYRPQLQKLFISALSMNQASQESTVEECAAQLIERLNHRSSWQPYGTVVGTTLRLKGLEFDNVIVLNPKTITAPNHLYVALSRPTKRLIVATTD